MTAEELGELYERYGYLVRRRCLAISGDAQDADDALQETFVRVQKYPPREVRSMLAYLYGVAARVCFDQLRVKRRAEPRADVADKLEERVHAAAPETRLSLGRELMKLDEVSREVALLHFLDGMTQEEIAARVGYSRRTIGTKLRDAQERLRAALAR